MLENSKKNRIFLSRLGSRGAFGKVIYDLLSEGEQFYAISADFAIPSGFAKSIEDFPDRIIDCGIAEQNMIGVAAGISDQTTPVFATSWGCFSSYRCADQIRVYLGLMRSNVKLVGLTSGLAGFQLGGSHYCIGDIALLRGIPGITILSPCDGIEIYQCVRWAYGFDGPVYIRLTGGNRLPMINVSDDYIYEMGKPNDLREGTDVIVLATGTILEHCLSAAEKLDSRGISCGVTNISTLKPLSLNIVDKIKNYNMAVVVEEHNVVGGLGSAVAEECSALGQNIKLVRIGIPDFVPKTGSYDYLLEQCGMQAEQIAERIESEYRLSGDKKYVDRKKCNYYRM